jgi:hypothetical protein
MERSSDKIVINGAVSQYDRWLRALDADYVQPDGRSFQELLNFAIRYARLIRFYGLDNQPSGDWVQFFLSDPTMILASIDAVNLQTIEVAYQSLEKDTAADTRFDPKFQGLRSMFQTILDMAREINGWLTAVDLNPAGTAARMLAADIAALIEGGLREQLRLLKAYADGAAQPEALGRSLELNFTGLAPIWQVGRPCPDATPYRGRTAIRRIDHALPYLSPIFWEFLDALTQLKQFARLHFPETLQESDHKPQIGLYIAFVQLFKTAQDTLNTLNNRYIDFYYRDVLRETNLGPVPDSVYLCFTLDPTQVPPLGSVPKGALFPAGQDPSGADILYAADKALGVTLATIVQLSTLRSVSGPLINEVSSRPAQLDESPLSPLSTVTHQVLQSEIDPTAPGAWPAFGPDRAGQTDTETTVPATMGFAIASNYLMLTQGERTVTIFLGYSENVQLELDALLQAIADATGRNPDDIFEEILANAFNLYISTPGGWFPIQSYQQFPPVESPPQTPGFCLTFTLPTSVPPIAGYTPEPDQKLDLAVVTGDPAVNATNPAPGVPTLKAYLQQTPVILKGENGSVEVYPLSLFEVVEIQIVQVQVHVSGVAGSIENRFGPLDTSAAFPVFGALVTPGAYIQATSAELFMKIPDPHSLKATFHWFNLPANETGFAGYYRDYIIGPDGKKTPDLFNNQVFRASVEVVNPGLWTARNVWPSWVKDPPPESDLYLFRTTENGCNYPIPTKDGTLCTASCFDTLEVVPTKGAPPYYDPSSSSLRLTLSAPSYAFGDDLYAKNVLNAVIADLPIQVGAETCACIPVCQPLWDTSQRLGKCLDNCKDTPPEQYEDCIAPCLRGCEERLILAFQGCFLQCLSQCPDPPDDFTVEMIEAFFDASSGATPAEQAQFLLCTLDGSPPFLSGCGLACFLSASTLLQAVLWIENCLTACSPPDGKCIEANVIACQIQLQQAYTTCIATEKELKYPNTPWIPTASNALLDYSAQCSFSPTDADSQCGSFYYLLPFNGSQSVAGSGAPAIPLLPSVEYPGNLYIGFTGLDSAQTLAMLFQMQATGIEDLPAVTWQYLSANEWVDFTSLQVRSDTTNGLQNTGILTLSVPALDDAGNTILSPENQWLRAVVAKDPSRFPGIAAIYPHSLTATWQNSGGTGENLSQPLPPLTIKSSVNEIPGIATIVQPLESFGGVPPENNRQFITRLGERLRHKGRAILSWDYERLVLNRFPTIWKVQALPARSRERGDSPGNVLVAVVAGPNSIEVADPTEPTATTELLSVIRSYLQGLASPFVNVDVVNPNYVRIQVAATVLFTDEDDTGTSIERLNKELIQYLSPWFYDASRAVLAGAYASEDAISEFIQTRPYVQGLVQIAYAYSPSPADLEWYFLTSATKHDILPG